MRQDAPSIGNSLKATSRWFVGLASLGILGGTIYVVTLRPTIERLIDLSGGIPLDVILPIFGLVGFLLVVTFGITSTILVKIFCDCGRSCGCGDLVPQLPGLPSPPDIPPSADVKKALDDLVQQLAHARDELASAIAAGDVRAANRARATISSLEQQIRALGG